MQNETPDFPTRLAACARQLRRHGFEAVCVADLVEAGRRLRDEIARCAPRSISYGDSMTLPRHRDRRRAAQRQPL